jgi:hypothetical protein
MTTIAITKENILQTLIDEFEARLNFSTIRLFNREIIQKANASAKKHPTKLAIGSLRGHYFEAYANWILSQINTLIPDCQGFICPQIVKKEPYAQEGLTRGKVGEIIINRSGYMLSEYDFLLIYADRIELFEMKCRLNANNDPYRKTYVRLNRLQQVSSLPVMGFVGSLKTEFSPHKLGKAKQFHLGKITFSRFAAFFQYIRAKKIPKIAAELPPQYLPLTSIAKRVVNYPKIEVKLLNLLMSYVTPDIDMQKKIRKKLLLVGSLPLGQLSLPASEITSSLFTSESLKFKVKENKNPFYLFLKHTGEQFQFKLYDSLIYQRFSHKHLKAAEYNPETMSFVRYHQSTGRESYKFHQIQALQAFHLPVIDEVTLQILLTLVSNLNDPKEFSNYSDQEILKLKSMFALLKYILRDLKVRRTKYKPKKKPKKKKSQKKKPQKKNPKKKQQHGKKPQKKSPQKRNPKKKTPKKPKS